MKSRPNEEEKIASKTPDLSNKSPIQVALDELVKYRPTKFSPIEGGYNKVSFKEVIGPQVTSSKGILSAFEVALIEYQYPSDHSQDETPEVKKNLLRKRKEAYDLIKNIKSPFLQKFLYFTPELRITLKAECDFYGWLFEKPHPKKYDITWYKNFIAMMIQAVADLHDQECVHLDLKPDNFLVYVIDGKMYLVLTDCDEVIKNRHYDKESNKIVMRYRPPEFKSNDNIKPTDNLNPFDIYCLAMSMLMALALIIPEMTCAEEEKDSIIKELEGRFKFDVKSGEHWKLIDFVIYIRTAPPEISAELNNLLDLLLHLLDSDPAKRWEIKQAMASPFFSDTLEGCQGFFKNLKEQAEQDLQLKIDGKLHTNPEIGDTFWLQDPNLKAIYQASKILDNKMRQFKRDRFVYGATQAAQMRFLRELTREVKVLSKQIEALLGDSKIESDTKRLNNLLTAIREEKACIRAKIIPPVPAYAANANTQWNGVATSPSSSLSSSVVSSSALVSGSEVRPPLS